LTTVPLDMIRLAHDRKRENLRKLLLFALSTLMLTSIAVPVVGQSVAILDFTSTKPKDRARQPKPFPPSTSFGGRCGGIVTNPPLSVSLLPLGKTEYTLGEELAYTVRLRNKGKSPVRVASRLSLADMEPGDSTRSYSYTPMEIWLIFRDSLTYTDSRDHMFSSRLVTLYGSSERPETEFELQSGEWFDIRGKALLEATVRTKGRVFSDYLMLTSLPDPGQKMVNVSVSAYFWRGDIVSFDAKTQYEYVTCHGYEVGEKYYETKLSITRPARAKNLARTGSPEM
jgi:hypothetical protein